MPVAVVWRPIEIVSDRRTSLFQVEVKEKETLCPIFLWKSRFPPFMLLSGDIMVHRCCTNSKCSACVNLLDTFASVVVFY